MGRRIGYLIIFLFFASPAFGATKYVSPTGSAAWANCNSTGTPCSVATAMSNAAAGDIVLFMDGTYNVPTSASYEIPSYNPSNSGTSENPITFKALNRHDAILKGRGGTSGSGIYLQPMIGAFGSDYIVWDGFYVYARDNGDTTNIFGNCRFDGSTGSKIINSRFVGGTHSYGGSANSAAVFVQGANYTVIENNEITGYREASNNENNAAILLYPSSYVTVKNNTLYDNTAGINLKDGASYATVSYNDIRNNCRGVYFANANGHNITGPVVEYNLIANNERQGISVSPDATTSNLVIRNNIIYHNVPSSTGDAEMEIKPGAASVYPKIYNNIVYRDYKSMQFDGSANNLAECDHNQWSTNLSITMHKYQTTANYTSLLAWQNSGELYGNENPGEGSLNSDPLFVNTSGTMTELADFALQAGSPCLGAGRDSEDMGVDITLVGVDAEEPPLDTTPPVRSNGSPSGTIEYTTTVTLSLSTNETATCKWDTSSGTAYASMTNTFTNTNSTSHSHASVAVSEGANIFYVRCEDGSDNENTNDYSISFTVEEDTPPPSPGTNFNILGTGTTSIGGGTGSLTIQ